MRVLLINQTFWPDHQATSQYLADWAGYLADQGHQVTVLTSRRAYADPGRQYPARETWRGVRIIRVWDAGLGQKAKWRRAVDFATFLLAATGRSLFLRADAVVTLTTPPLISALGGILSLLWGAKFVYWVMDLNPDEAIAVGYLRAGSLLARFLEAVSRWTLRRATKVVVLDRYMRERIVAKGIDPAQVEAIPLWLQHGIGYDPAGRDAFRQRHGFGGKHLVMYSGNHTPCHPLETMVQAAHLLRDDPRFAFCFNGGGTEWAKLRARAQAEGWTNTTFLPYQPLAELSGALSAADSLVVVMGDPFVGIVHPCKIYNFFAVQRPFIYIGPSSSHVTDLIEQAGLQRQAATFRHGESGPLADELRRRADAPPAPWPNAAAFLPWQSPRLLEEITATLG